MNLEQTEPEYVIRMRIELENLQIRVTALGQFIDSDMYHNLGFSEQRLMAAQYGAMMAYEQILGVRLNIQ